MTERGRRQPHVDLAWPVAEAKARLSELLQSAVTDGPQMIANRGRPVAVVVSVEEWERKTRREGTLADFFDAIRPDGAGELQVPDLDWSTSPDDLPR